MNLSFVIPGAPLPAGSKTIVPTAAGSRAVDGKSTTARASRAAWRADIIELAKRAMADAGWDKSTAPIRLVVTFWVPRPKNVRPVRRDGSIPLPVKRPDSLKYARGLEDALTLAGVWGDDSQVVDHSISKRYCLDTPATHVVVVELDEMPRYRDASADYEINRHLRSGPADAI